MTILVLLGIALLASCEQQARKQAQETNTRDVPAHEAGTTPADSPETIALKIQAVELAKKTEPAPLPTAVIEDPRKKSESEACLRPTPEMIASWKAKIRAQIMESRRKMPEDRETRE